MEPDGTMERELRAAGFPLVAGVDEVGRGALAGPLVAAAVILDGDAFIPGLKDSKMLTERQRNEIAVLVRKRAVAISIVRVSPAVIDRRGLHKSNLWALRQAVARLQPLPSYVLSDGFRPKRLPIPVLSIKKGDEITASVAAASVIAKVTRDRTMRRLARKYPAYGFKTNVGYGTDEHWEALRAHGATPVHRMSFNGVADPWKFVREQPSVGASADGRIEVMSV